MVTGKEMLENLERIFRELDEMGVPMGYAVGCPHGTPKTPGEPPYRRFFTFRGRRLEFCDKCHDAIEDEMKAMNRNLQSPAPASAGTGGGERRKDLW